MSVHEDEVQEKITVADSLILASGISEENVLKETSWISRFSGIFYTLTASFLYVSTNFTIQQLHVDLLDASLFRFLLQTIIVLAFACYKNYTLLGGTAWQIFLQLFCCMTGAGGFILYCVAIRYIELSDANTLAYTRVVWTMVLSIIIYRERPSISTLLALPLTLLGVVFVTQPNFLFSSTDRTTNEISQKFRILGFVMILMVALTSAINVLLFKQLISSSRDIKPSVLSLQYSASILVLLIFNQLYKIFYLQTVTSFSYMLSWRFLLSSFICLIPIGATVLVQKAIKREHPAVFSLLGSADIIFALILQNIFTSVRSNLYALFGTGLVISSVVVLGIARIINERRAQKKEKENDKC